VTGVKTFTAPSGRTFEILKTNEMDEYDAPPDKSATEKPRKGTRQP
jgi:hypothetical protein